MDANLSIDETVKACFRDMVITDSFKKVTVSSLCKQANISRKTFYNYFNDKYAVLECIFSDDATAATEKIYPLFSEKDFDISPPLLTERMYQGLYDNKEFYLRVVSEDDAHIFIRIVQKCTTELHKRLVKGDGGRLDDKVRYACCYGSGAQSAIITQWVRDGMTIPPHQLAEWTAEWMLPSARVGFVKTGLK